MIYCLKEYPKDREPIEIIQLTDKNENLWTIQRYENYGIVIHFESDRGLMPQFFIYSANNQVMNLLNSNFIHYEDESFEEFMRLRNWIINASTEECFILIEDLFQQRFRLDPYLVMECETIF